MHAGNLPRLRAFPDLSVTELLRQQQQQQQQSSGLRSSSLAQQLARQMVPRRLPAPAAAVMPPSTGHGSIGTGGSSSSSGMLLRPRQLVAAAASCPAAQPGDVQESVLTAWGRARRALEPEVMLPESQLMSTAGSLPVSKPEGQVAVRALATAAAGGVGSGSDVGIDFSKSAGLLAVMAALLQ
jgi:hypothetical protein